MLWDAGLGAAMMDNMTAVENKIAELEETFSLVMLADRWDEAVVLLREELCWNTRDVVNFKLNARKQTNRSPLSAAARAGLQAWLAADYKLYNHFKARFEARVARFGARRMETEVAALRAANKEMQERCGIAAADNDKVDTKYCLSRKEKE